MGCFLGSSLSKMSLPVWHHLMTAGSLKTLQPNELPPKWTSQLGSCCCIFDSCIKLKNFSKTVRQCLCSQHPASVSAALLVPGVPNEGFPWRILSPILGRKIGVSNLEDVILYFLIWINLLPSVHWLISVLCVKLQLLGVLLKWGKLLDTSQSLNRAAFLFSSTVA